MPPEKSPKISSAFEKMDRMYRHQRYFYDLTRKYYLLGRDRLLDEIEVEPGANILEIGCGTARNLIILAEKYPAANFFGLDASSEMLKTAETNVNARKLTNITLKTALADQFSFEKNFNLSQKFDAIFFSYALSIIPVWRESIANALENLKNGASLSIVDFYDQKDLPDRFQKILQKWLAKFHVKYPSELLPFLRELEQKGIGELKFKTHLRRYSLIIKFTKTDGRD